MRAGNGHSELQQQLTKTPKGEGAKRVSRATGGPLERKYEQLLALGGVGVGPDPTMAQRMQKGDIEALIKYYQAVEERVRIDLLLTLRKCAGTVCPDESLKLQKSWRTLANDPKRFNRSLDKLLGGIRTCMKLLYQVPDHRPSKHQERDKAVFYTKLRNPSLSFGQVAIKYRAEHPEDPIDAKLAERSHKRFTAKRIALAKRIAQAAARHIATQQWSEDDIAKALPKPEEILDILTSDD